MKNETKKLVKNKYFKLVLYFITIGFLYQAYIYIFNNHILSNCNGISGGLGYAGYTCYGYYGLFFNISIYIYILIIWFITPIFFNKIKKFYYTYTIGIVILFIILFFNIINTPIININDLPKGNSIFK